jgi:D-glycero-alpha-D-manno-heptose 1-phosphate guanylyltransferase
MIEAIVLAGGFGTRLRSVVSDVPKPMAPIGNKPFLAYLMDHLAKNGVNRVILSVGYMSEKIIDYFGCQYAGMEVIYSKEEIPLGTGGAIKLALNLALGDHVFVFNGDTFLNIELDKVELLWKKIQKPVIVGVSVVDASRFGELKISESRLIVEGFLEKSSEGCGIINAGCYLLPTNILQEFQNEVNFSFEKDFLQYKNNILKFAFYESIGEFIDIGIPSDYIKANSIIFNGCS